MDWKNTERILNEYAMMVSERYKESLMKNGHIATGELLNSVKYQITIGNKEVSVSLVLDEVWKWVENDCKPHFPPIDAILKWVKVKEILPSKTYDGKLPTEKQLAFLIARKISERGTTGTHDLRDAMNQLNQTFEVRLGEAVAKDIEGALTSILTQMKAD